LESQEEGALWGEGHCLYSSPSTSQWGDVGVGCSERESEGGSPRGGIQKGYSFGWVNVSSYLGVWREFKNRSTGAVKEMGTEGGGGGEGKCVRRWVGVRDGSLV